MNDKYNFEVAASLLEQEDYRQLWAYTLPYAEAEDSDAVSNLFRLDKRRRELASSRPQKHFSRGAREIRFAPFRSLRTHPRSLHC